MGVLMLQVPSEQTGDFLSGFSPGEYDIKPTKKKRSLSANGYLWALCDQIARKLSIPGDVVTKEEIYKRSIISVGKYTPMPIKEEAVEDFRKIWQSNGTGWVLEVVDDSKLEGYKFCRAYHGSSTYDVKDFSKLLDFVIQDAKSIGIETMQEEDLKSLLETWGGR